MNPMTLTLAFAVLLAAWKALDWIELRHADARARLDSDVRSRQRMRAVVSISERRQS